MFKMIKGKLKKLIVNGLTNANVRKILRECYSLLRLYSLAKEIVFLLASLIGFYSFGSRCEFF